MYNEASRGNSNPSFSAPSPTSWTSKYVIFKNRPDPCSKDRIIQGQIQKRIKEAVAWTMKIFRIMILWGGLQNLME